MGGLPRLRLSKKRSAMRAPRSGAPNLPTSRGLLLIAASSVILFSGCRSHHHPDTMARARFIDTVPGGDVAVWVNGKEATERAEYRQSSGYVELPPGRYDLRVSAADGTALASLHSVSLTKGESYTLVAIPRKLPGTALLQVMHEGAPPPNPSDRAMLRFTSATPEFNNLDLALNNIVAVDGLRFGTESDRIALPPGDYDAKLWVADGVSPLLGPEPIHLAAGHAYTIVAMGRRADNTLALKLYDDGE
jgi:hypothetical protein